MGVRLLIPADPVVNGSPMSEWVRKLTERWTSAHGAYSYPPGVRAAMAADSDAAIVHLIGAVKDRPRAFDGIRVKVGKRLPPFLARVLVPKRPRCRWAGVMALSHLAYKQPDVRIDRVFQQCISDPDPLVRKIAAYELGPWIFPNEPRIAAELMRKALSDPVSDVRRDACRRIAMIDGAQYPQYVSHLQSSLNEVDRLMRTDPSRDVRRQAERAYNALRGGDLVLVHPTSPNP